MGAGCWWQCSRRGPGEGGVEGSLGHGGVGGRVGARSVSGSPRDLSQVPPL